jgi:hypothetical protein
MPKAKIYVIGIILLGKIRVSYNNLLTSVPDGVRKTFNSVKFLFLELDNKTDRKTLIFTTYCNLIHLDNTYVCVFYGTFYACPSEFSQLYTSQGLLRGKFYPLVFCLMHRCDYLVYEVFFEFLSLNFMSFPKNVIFDFEMAPINTMLKFFTETHLSGCFFYFSQILRRKVQTQGLTVMYKENLGFQQRLKMIVSFALVPCRFVAK